MLKLINPVDGDWLNKYDGEVTADGLRVKVETNGENVEVNGSSDGYVTLREGANTLLCTDKSNGEKVAATLFYHSDVTGYFRISVDDNILFLQDINDNKDIYKSIFENPFLGMFKRAHDKYGVCVHINLFYEYNDESMVRFAEHKKQFNLSMMTDKFRDEFIANSGWLHFSFHSRAEFPDRPYVDSTYEQIDEDIKLIKGEIERFAGAEISPPVTTVHWGSANYQCVQALHANGYRLLNGEYTVMDGGPHVAYYHDLDRCAHLRTRDFWYDSDTDIIFATYETVLNFYKSPEQMYPVLDEILADPHKAGYLELLIHEQYFYSDYVNYIPRYGDVIMAACEYATNHGYRSRFFTEVCGL